ncbi:MAG: type II secretion system F family protein [Planctomycetota bacterium]
MQLEYNVLDITEPTETGTTEKVDRVPALQDDTGGVFSRVRTMDLARLVRQLAMLLRSGMPLVHALSAIAEQLEGTPESPAAHTTAKERRLAQITKRLAADVDAGGSLSFALGKNPVIFSPLFVSMVAAGEAGGTIEDTLLRLADMLEKKVRLTAKIRAALAYPIMMVIVAVAVVAFLLSFVVPDITKVFIEMNRALPWPTRLLIGISHFAGTYFVLLLILAIAGLFALRKKCKTARGRLAFDHFKLRLPIFGKVLLKIETARLSRTLAALLASGVSILTAIEIAKDVVGNSILVSALDSVRDSVSKGGDVAAAIKKTGFFPPIVSHIIATGQLSGELETGLANIADMYDGEVENALKTAVSLLEPAVLLVMGLVVGFIVFAIMLPILEINQAL